MPFQIDGPSSLAPGKGFAVRRGCFPGRGQLRMKLLVGSASALSCPHACSLAMALFIHGV